jgi:hypothetical protein
MTRRSLYTSVALVVLGALALSAEACGSSKVCTTEEVKKCDADLSTCIAKPACADPTNPGYQACVDACANANCDCQTACGNTCTKK